MRLLHRFCVREPIDDGKMCRLEEAERELRDLQDRAERAIIALDHRRAENHWRESITRMINGE